MTDPRRVDPLWFRQVLGQYPTGVCVVTAIADDGTPAGMAVGSFTSVSLDPPLVAFLPDKRSTSWPSIRSAGAFCVNVLGADQEPLCRAFAAKGADKFTGLRWTPADSGAPILEGVSAWIDCDLDAVHDAGDHYIVIGRVRALDIASPSLPLLFFQGGYGRFIPQSLVTADGDLIGQLRQVDLARPVMEALARDVGVEVTAYARVGDETVIVASAGQPRGRQMPTRVGQRYPFMPPIGALFVAWAGDDAVQAWLRRADPDVAGPDLDVYRRALERVRFRGYTLTLGDALASTLDAITARFVAVSPASLKRVIAELAPQFNPDDLPRERVYQVAAISAPIFDANRSASLGLTLYGFEGRATAPEIDAFGERLVGAARRVTELSGGRSPDSPPC